MLLCALVILTTVISFSKAQLAIPWPTKYPGEITTVKCEYTTEKYVTYAPRERYLRHGMSRMERFILKKAKYNRYLKKQYQHFLKYPEELVKRDFFEELNDYNKRHGYTLSKGTCDRRGISVCKNACSKSYKKLCEDSDCDSGFKKEMRRECKWRCRHEFKKDFGAKKKPIG